MGTRKCRTGTSRRLGTVGVFGVLASAGAICAPLSFGASAALAADAVTQQVKLTQSNWYWESPFTLPVEAPAPVPIPDNPIPAGVLIPDGDLATSLTNSADQHADRVTYLQFGVGSANDTARVKHFTFTLQVDSANLTNYPPGQIPALAACYPSRSWEAGKGSTPYTEKPQEDCDGAAEGKYDPATESYTFDVASFAQDWVQGTNLGVAVRPSVKQLTPFVLAFKGPKTVTAAITFVQGAPRPAPGAGTPIASGPVMLPDVSPAGPADPSGQAGPDVALAAPVQLPVTPTAIAPTVADPKGAGVFTAAAGNRVIGETSYDTRFWLALVAGLAPLALVGWFVSRRPTPVRVAATSSRLTQVLAARAAARHASQ